MPFQRPSITEIITRIKSDFNARIEDARTFLRRSFFAVASTVMGGVAHLLYEYINYVKDQLFALTADAEHLDRLGDEMGVAKGTGVKATGTALATGTAGTAIGVNTTLTSQTGLIYRVTTATSIGTGGTVSIALEAEKSGTSYNAASGTVLSFVSPISSINTDVTVESAGIENGTNAETTDQYRARVLLRKRFPPHGGIREDYVAWALEVTGVTRAWSVPEYQGIGTIGVAFVRDNDTGGIFPDETERTEVRDHIISHTDPILLKEVGIPVTAQNGLFVIVNRAKTVDMTIEISPNTSAIQTAVTSKLTDLIQNSGGAELTITVSEFYEAIMAATNIIKSRVIVPAADVTANANEVHVLGTITYQDYS